MSAAAPRTALGFDYGKKRIGVAVGQTVSRTASALATLPAREGQPDWQVLARLLDEWQPDLLVVGMPTTADGNPHPLAPAIERFARRLAGRFGKPVVFVDERLTSWEAEGLVRESRHGVDALAARALLETWLAESA